VKLVDVDAGKWSTPAHVEGAEEEIFFVLAGSGLSWQDGATYEVRAGDCLVHLAEAEAHTLRAGPDGLRLLAYGQRLPHGNTVLPRAGVAWMSPGFVDVTVIGEQRSPYHREAEAGEPEVAEPTERPPSIVNLDDVPGEVYDRPGYAGLERDLARAAGSHATGLRHVVLEPGCLSAPPHCHSAEEEIFVVLEGEGTLLLGEDEHPVRAGSVVARPPGTRISHVPRVRHARAERHRLLPPLRQGVFPRHRPHDPSRAAGLLGRRALIPTYAPSGPSSRLGGHWPSP
jgi:uncharacterized cupin superfamily protein